MSGILSRVPLPFSDEPDSHLADLVRLANDGVIESGVTLFVEGLVISGHIISGSTYFTEFGKMYASGTDDKDLGNRLNKKFSDRASLYTQSDTDEGQPDPAFIHLRDAQVIVPGQEAAPAEGCLWRGRLIKVSGFALGRFGTRRS